MIVEYVRYRVDEADEAAFLADYARAALVLERAPQCVDYELSRSVDEPACHVLRIGWTSAEDHLQGFRGGELFPEFLAAIRPSVVNIEEMRQYERTAVSGTGSSVPSIYERAGGMPALERLTRLFYERVLANSQPGAQVARSAPVPHWGWGVAPPWQG